VKVENSFKSSVLLPLHRDPDGCHHGVLVHIEAATRATTTSIRTSLPKQKVPPGNLVAMKTLRRGALCFEPIRSDGVGSRLQAPLNCCQSTRLRVFIATRFPGGTFCFGKEVRMDG